MASTACVIPDVVAVVASWTVPSLLNTALFRSETSA